VALGDPQLLDNRIDPEDPVRVIPRPSERYRSADDITIIGEPAPAAPKGARLDKDERAFGFLLLLATTGAAVSFGALGMTGELATTSGIALVPLFMLVNWFLLHRYVRPQTGAGFVTLATAGLALRYLAAVPRMWGGVDSIDYQRSGERLAEHFRSFDFVVDTGRAIPGTGALRYLSGIVNVFTGSSFLATFLVFATLAFWGQVWFLLACRDALTTRQFRLATVLLMVWPSLAFWPSSIGKEAAALFGLGLASLGVSKVLRRDIRGLPLLVLGVAAVGLIRPHVAMIVLAALAAGVLARQTGTRKGFGSQVLVVILVTVGAMLLTDASARLFGLEQLDGIQDVSVALDFAQDRTSQDQSQFVAPRVESIVDYPWAFVTVTTRPFPWEADSMTAVITGAEGLVLSVLLLAAVPGLIGEIGAFFTRGVLLYSVAYISVFVFLFSAMGNFGILSRQRAQLLPFVLLVAAVGLAHQRHVAREARVIR